jgi:hypothetical protein
MKRNAGFLVLVSGIIIINACNQPAEATKDTGNAKSDTSNFAGQEKATPTMVTELLNKPVDYVPAGYHIVDSVKGDLNNDQLADCILIIKEVNKKNIVKDEYRGMLDRNRRGIIILLNKNGRYEELAKNYQCFSSENEDGGVYYAPELDVKINKGNLIVNYSHGRYGYWFYTFRIHNNDMQLIGYDASSNTGPVTDRETSINFLTKKKQVRENTNHDAGPSEEVFKESWSVIKLDTPLLLSHIKDFEEMDMYGY